MGKLMDVDELLARHGLKDSDRRVARESVRDSGGNARQRQRYLTAVAKALDNGLANNDLAALSEWVRDARALLAEVLRP